MLLLLKLLGIVAVGDCVSSGSCGVAIDCAGCVGNVMVCPWWCIWGCICTGGIGMGCV